MHKAPQTDNAATRACREQKIVEHLMASKRSGKTTDKTTTTVSQAGSLDWLDDGHQPDQAAISDTNQSSMGTPDIHQVMCGINALRFCKLFESVDAFAALHDAGSYTELLINRGEDTTQLSRSLTATLEALDQVSPLPGVAFSDVEILGDHKASQHSRNFAAEHARSLGALLRESLLSHKPAIVLVPSGVALDARFAPALSQRLVLPPPSSAMIRRVLTFIYPEAMSVSDLPEDQALSRIDPQLLSLALVSHDAETAIRRLTRYAERISKKSGPTLDKIALPKSIRTRLERLTRDFGRWRKNDVSWFETPHSVMVSGPPGVGKTLLATALAQSLDVPLISTSYSECQAAGHLGDYLAAMHEKIAEAVSRVPCIFFIDEFDSFSRRGGSDRNAHYSRQVVNDMLAQLSRMHDTAGVILIAATNFPDHVDPALTRAGRFDIKLELGLPDEVGITLILRQALASLTPDMSIVQSAAKQLVGQSGALVAAVARDALALARDEGKRLEPGHLDTAIKTHVPIRNHEALWRMAVHEAGHVIVGAALGLTLPQSVSIHAKGGHTEMSAPPYVTAETALDWVRMLLGGRAAEQSVFGAPSSLAGGDPESDIGLATRLLLDLDRTMGLGDCGLVYTPALPDHLHLMPDWQRKKIETVLRECSAEAAGILRRHRSTFLQLANTLLDERSLDQEALSAILAPMSQMASPPLEAMPETVIPLHSQP